MPSFEESLKKLHASSRILKPVSELQSPRLDVRAWRIQAGLAQDIPAWLA